MPESKKKKSTKKEMPNQKSSANSESSANNHQGLWEVCQWLLLFVLVFFAICLFAGDVLGVIGTGIQQLLLGLFGIGAYPFIITVIIAFFLKMVKPSIKILWRMLAFDAFLALFSAFFHLLNGDAFYTIASAFHNATPVTGGIVGFLIGTGLVTLVNKVGAYILTVGLGLLFLGLTVGVSFKKVLQNRAQKDAENLERHREERAERKAERQNQEATSKSFPNGKELPRVHSYLDSNETSEEPQNETIYHIKPDQTHGPNRTPIKDGVLDLPLTEPYSRHTSDNTESQGQTNETHPPKFTSISSKNQETKRTRTVHTAHRVETESTGSYATNKAKYVFPSINLLKAPETRSSRSTKQELYRNGQKLEAALKMFEVEASVQQVNRGPAVTRFEVLPAPGVKVKAISSLADDLARTMSAKSIRIEAPIPGKNVVGIEIPNSERETVYLREILESNAFKTSKSRLTVALGRSIDGGIEITELSKMPHLLIAGATGSGKSVCINSLIISLLYKSTPEEVQLVMIDPKIVELSVYNGIPHLCTENREVISDPKKAAVVLNQMVSEMTRRYQLFREYNVRDFYGYNEKISKLNDETALPLPHIVIIIDELADLMLVAAKSVEESFKRLSAMARAAGMHLVVATQRPSVDVITGTIKNNLPCRMAFAVSSSFDSKTILNSIGAETLLGKGDMLFDATWESGFRRIQGTFVSDAEVEAVVEAIKRYPSPDNLVDMTIPAGDSSSVSSSDDSGEGGDSEEMYREAVQFVVSTQRVSISSIQRRFHIGFNRASDIVERMEADGIVSPPNTAGKRAVLAQQQGE